MNTKYYIKIIAAFVLGILLSMVLVYHVTDMYSTYMNLYNFATFSIIFVLGASGLTVIFVVYQKLRRKTITREFIVKRGFISLVYMNLFLVVFGLYFYDYSTPKPVPFGGSYSNVYRAPSLLNDGWSVSSLRSLPSMRTFRSSRSGGRSPRTGWSSSSTW